MEEANKPFDATLGARRVLQLRAGLLASLLVAALAGVMLELALPWPWLATVLALMLAANVITARRLARGKFLPVSLARQLAFDLTAMAALLYLTGGATNPLVSLLLLPVTAAALALPMRQTMGLAVLAALFYSLLMVFSLPLPIDDVARATRLHLIGMWLTFVVSAFLIAWFLTRMTAAIRSRDAELAASREQALRDAQVVALAQLAAGAAHELGTPLATMRVLCDELAGDRRLPADCLADIDILRRQIEHCKAIIGGMTLRAGLGRAEEMTVTPAEQWLAGLLERWRSLWPQAQARFVCMRNDEPPPALAPPPAIEQAITSLLNNAARVAPQGIELMLDWDDECLKISVADHGPGFSPPVLATAGADPMPAHEQGSGLGLWLARTAVERHGGRLRLANTEKGACVTVALPRLRQG